MSVPLSGIVYVDTAVVVYTVEAVVEYESLVRPFWEACAEGAVSVVSSELTLLETLVVPIRDGNGDLVSAYEEFLLRGDVRLLPIAQRVLREAARLRATTSVRTPDAIHLASAAAASCDAFLTNDRRLRGVPGLPVLILDDCR